MPLTSELPVIDDRTYGDIVAEIRARIARYTPEWNPQWSDVNDNEPGTILAQTFAWLAEMLLFRMKRVPQLNYIKFLQLIGIELIPAQPARAEISFAVADTWPLPTVLVPPGTQVSAESDDGTPIVFETEDALTAVAAALRSVQAYDGAVHEDLTRRNADPNAPASGFFPFGEAPREDAALLLGFELPATYPIFPAIGVDLAFFAADTPGEGRVSQCGIPATRAYAPARLAWEGFDGTDWQRLDAFNDETLAFTRSGHIVVRVPANVALQRAFVGDYDAIDPETQQPRDPLFWFRGRLTRSQYERPPRLAAVRTNTVRALQAQTVRNEVLGGTTGARDQTFQTENTPVIKGSLKVTIDQGTEAGPVEWTIVDDLFGSRPEDDHLAVNWSSGQVLAGNGETGQIPVANAANPDSNVIATVYRFGGGARGNVNAGALTTLLTPIDGIDPAGVTNMFAASAGRDEETLREAQVRARRALAARERAVTPQDFELLAQQAGNVRRAKALPLAHPQFPGVRVPGAVTVIVVPDSTVPNPQPSDGLLRTVCEYLDARRLLTTELFVVGPRYVRVSVRATIVARDSANTAAVKNAVEDALSKYLHPLVGGDEGGGWPFGGAVRYSKVMQRAFVDGVDSIRDLVLTVDDEPQQECRDVAIEPANALVYSTTHQIEVVTAREVEELV